MSNGCIKGSAGKFDGEKLKLSLVPPEIVPAIAEIRHYGTEKYGDPDNWKTIEPQRYWEALLRHVLASWEDYKAVDPESGMPHLWHIATNASFILALDKDVVKTCDKELCDGEDKQ